MNERDSVAGYFTKRSMSDFTVEFGFISVWTVLQEGSGGRRMCGVISRD